MNIHIIASGSDGNAYLLDDGKSPLLIEAGIPFKVLQSRIWVYGYKISDLAGCLISHHHGDHSKAVPQLLKHGVDCFMELGTARGLKVANHHRIYFRNSPDFWTPGNNKWIVSPFPAIHLNSDGSDCPCLGFLIANGDNRIVYLSDSAYSKYTFPGVTHYLLACDYDADMLQENIENGSFHPAGKKRLLHSHASLDTVKEMLTVADKSKLKEVWLLHISDRNGDPEKFKEEIKAITGVPVYA